MKISGGFNMLKQSKFGIDMVYMSCPFVVTNLTSAGFHGSNEATCAEEGYMAAKGYPKSIKAC